MVKLIDFGFSNQYSDDELLRTSCGSLAYSAPEILLGLFTFSLLTLGLNLIFLGNKYDGPKVDIWGLGCILYILLYGSNPFMQFNDNETLIKYVCSTSQGTLLKSTICRILDCSFTTPERPTINQASIDLIKGLLKKDPESRLTIDEIINHPWMASSDLSAASCDKREIAKMPVQEHIIEQMIDQGISLSKDTIEKILRNEHSDTGDGDNLNDHHYIKATYHLLKDKSARECKGVDRNMNSTYNRRGNIMKKPNYSKLKKLHNIQEKKVIGNTVDVDSLKSIETQELDVPQNTASLLLPLARKCSIVSEEGNSCAESNLPEQSTLDTNDVTTNSIESIQPKVNIFVTESSNDTPDTPTFDHDDDRKPNYEDNSLAKKLAASLSCKDSGGLHSVSSSPDFMNEHFSNIEEETPSLVASIDAARNANQLKNDQDRTLTTIQDEPSILNRYTNFQKNKKLPNVRVMKPVAASVEHSSLNPNGKSPSMRVIIQSKSMNNLTLDEQPPETKITNSISNVSIKARKTEKADCCVIS